MTTAPLMTADELWNSDLADQRVELVKGVLVVSEPPGFLHGSVTARITKLLMDHVDANGLGVIVAGDAGFWIARGPDTVRGPDVAFIARDRAPDPRWERFAEVAPDLVVEVLSPHDRPGAVLAKVGDWLSAGSHLVWVVDPRRRQARVYRADGSATLLQETDALDGEDVLPGFCCVLGDVLRS
jgi:Uma2 family endonuclease